MLVKTMHFQCKALASTNEDIINKIDNRTNAHKQRLEIMKGKSQIAIDMIKRAVNSGIYVDNLPLWTSGILNIFIKEMNTLGLKVISRMANNNKIWDFVGEEKALDAIYSKLKEIKKVKPSQYGKKIKFTYSSFTVEHKNADKLKIVFINTKEKLILIVSFDLDINDQEIIEIYKKRWDIEQC